MTQTGERLRLAHLAAWGRGKKGTREGWVGDVKSGNVWHHVTVIRLRWWQRRRWYLDGKRVPRSHPFIRQAMDDDFARRWFLG